METGLVKKIREELRLLERRLELCDRCLDLIVGAAPEGSAALVLVILSDLGTQMSATGVDNQEEATILRTIHLNEVITSTN